MSADKLVAAAWALRDACGALRFGPPVTVVYNPLVYAAAPHERYLRRWGRGQKRVVFIGMNPGPWGMAQVGVPFGEIGLVREWLGIDGNVGTPTVMHAKRPIEGFACKRSEVSGRRLWGYFARRFVTPDAFFAQHFVINYCPLLFFDDAGRNITPDKLRAADREALFNVCDEHLRAVAAAVQPEWCIGVGKFAAGRAAHALEGRGVKIGDILHPSPASPAANRGWDAAVEKRMRSIGAWS